MYVLEKLWRGSLTPSEKSIRRGGEYHRLMEELCETEEQLEAELTPGAREVFHRYQQIQTELQDIENRENFMEAFRMGAQLILDVISEYQGEFRYSAEE